MIYYICDGTPENFFTAVFTAYNRKDCVITSDNNVQLTFGSEIVKIFTDREKSLRVQRGIHSCDKEAVSDILLVLRSCESTKEQVCLNYIRQLMKHKLPIKKAYNLPEVVAFNDLQYKVTGEIHRLKGFLRFMENTEGFFYAPYAPDNNITDLIMPHFTERFKTEKFIIHDIKREIAGVYNGNDWLMGYLSQAEINLSAEETAFVSLWKKYYKSVNIAERPHEKQMKGYMPVRYWKFLPEKNSFNDK